MLGLRGTRRLRLGEKPLGFGAALIGGRGGAWACEPVAESGRGVPRPTRP
jgi:hypothetical protein